MGPAVNIEERDAFYDRLVEAVERGEWTWGEAIRRLRKDVAGMNQKTFAKVTKVSERSLRQLEKDEGNPTVATLNAVLKPFGLKLGFLRNS